MEEDNNKKEEEEEEEINSNFNNNKKNEMIINISFEQIIIDDVLYHVFRQLYLLPVTKGNQGFNCMLVNKRWKSIWEHPLQTFLKGVYNANLSYFPPSYYRDEYGVYTKVTRSIGMTRHILAVTDKEVKHEEFVLSEMFHHKFILVKSKNKRINEKIIRTAHSYAIVYKPPYVAAKEEVKYDISRLVNFESRGQVVADEQLREHMVRLNGEALEFFPISLRSEEVCRMAVSENGKALEFVPLSLRTKELCKIAVHQIGDALLYVPERFKRDVCKIALKGNGKALLFLQEKDRTKELYQLAVQQNGSLIYSVPKAKRTKELYMLAVQQDPVGEILKYMPPPLKTEEMCILAVRANADSIKYVPKHLIDTVMNS